MVTMIRVEPTPAQSAAPVIPASTAGGFSRNTTLPASSSDQPQRRAPVVGIERKVRRSVSPIRGMVLEKLGHAIEYLTDEYAFEAAVSGTLVAGDPVLQAIQLLMSLNRQVYFECPVIEPLAQRIFSRLFPNHPVPSAN